MDGGRVQVANPRWHRCPCQKDGPKTFRPMKGWLQGRRALRERIVPASERDVELARLKPLNTNSAADSRLEERVVAEFEAASRCLDNGNGM